MIIRTFKLQECRSFGIFRNRLFNPEEHSRIIIIIIFPLKLLMMIHTSLWKHFLILDPSVMSCNPQAGPRSIEACWSIFWCWTPSVEVMEACVLKLVPQLQMCSYIAINLFLFFHIFQSLLQILLSHLQSLQQGAVLCTCLVSIVLVALGFRV